MPWINHLPPVCWSTFGILVWNDSGYVNLTQWWYFFIILSIFYISQRLTLWYFVFLYLIFLSQQVLYFLLSTLVLTLYIDVVLSLSIVFNRLPELCSTQEIPCIQNPHLFIYVQLTCGSNGLISLYDIWIRAPLPSFSFCNLIAGHLRCPALLLIILQCALWLAFLRKRHVFKVIQFLV